MKPQTVLSIALIAASSLSFSVYAADMETTPAPEAQIKKAPAKKVKPHFHPEEKYGSAQPSPKATTDEKSDMSADKKSDKPKVDKDK